MSTPARSSADAASSADTRPIFAVVTGHLPPYREHFHRRLASELKDYRLATLVTKFRTGPWVNPSVPEIGTVMFEPDDPGALSTGAKFMHERAKARAVRRWLEDHRPRAVMNIGYDEIPNFEAMRWARRRRVPVYLWADSNIYGDLTRGTKRLLKNVYVPWVCSKFTGVMVCGRAGEAYFEKYGVARQRMFRVPYEPDYRLVQDMTPERAQALCREAGLEPEPSRRRLVCCCRLIDVKRVDLVIAAFAACAKLEPAWDLVIVGDGPLMGDLKKQATDLGLSERVKFLGFQDQEHVTGIYRSSHALVLASDYEPWALVVNEAVAAGLAIVASDRVGAALELVDDGVNGRIVKAGDVQGLTAAVREVMNAHERMGQASLKVLERWRREADPVEGIRRALSANKV